MKSQFPFRSEFEESLNIYPKKIFSLKLEGFYEVLEALGIFVSWFIVLKKDYGFTWNNSIVTRGGVKHFYLTGELCRVHK